MISAVQGVQSDLVAKTMASGLKDHDILRCGVCGPRSLREGVELKAAECYPNGFRRSAVDLYVECHGRHCGNKITIKCLEHWRTAYATFKKDEVREGEDVVDDEGWWAFLESGVWRDGTKTDFYKPATGGRPAHIKRCMNCEESVVPLATRAIEPGFVDAKPDVEVDFLQPVSSIEKLDNGLDGRIIKVQYDVVEMFPLVADEACPEYFKGARDQPGRVPGVPPTQLLPLPPRSRVVRPPEEHLSSASRWL